MKCLDFEGLLQQYSNNYDGQGATHGASVQHEQTRSHEIIRSVGSGPNATKLYTKVITA